ncbi:predicted protein [Micromonas commoda]|uniref:Uncharacterized protein n=1 Tax=Micromonas commoda (strain RCC299 / NOUM17 / CCMP2709) TaxID=296587 RepID=C1FDZ9_MICCC|nr:predicted protein [Micromonas commoda]ACO68479.1 predicted protein [Micromonas commoda]|eukprot:XP_002507221.1 predicted protein [Micromonas commoda]
MMTGLHEPSPANDLSAIRVRARRNARDAMLSFVQNPNRGSSNSKQAAQLLTRRKIKRNSRTSQISSHEFNELVVALSSWHAICIRRRRVNVHRAILSPVTKSVMIPGEWKSCVLLDTFGKGTKFFHSSKFLTPRKFGALQWYSQQVVDHEIETAKSSQMCSTGCKCFSLRPLFGLSMSEKFIYGKKLFGSTGGCQVQDSHAE